MPFTTIHSLDRVLEQCVYVGERLDDSERAGAAELFAVVLVGVGAAGEADDAHAGGGCRGDAGDGVFYDEAVVGVGVHGACGVEVDVGRGLGVLDVVGAEDVWLEVFEKAGDTERQPEVLVAAVGDDRAGEGEGGEEGLGAGDLAEFGAAFLSDERADAVHEVGREGDPLVFLNPADDVGEVGADEGADALVR